MARHNRGAFIVNINMLERLALALGVSITEVVSRAEGISARTEETLYVEKVSRLVAGLDREKQRLAVDLVKALGRSETKP